jgi:hypothetical protein
VTADRSKAPDDDHQVLAFRRPGAPPGHGWHFRPSAADPPAPSGESLAKYEGGQADDNYGHRMLVNLAALVFTVMLAIAGGWLAIKIAEMRKNQDCVLSGRRNCAQIDVKTTEP